jgi:hypothetical protein
VANPLSLSFLFIYFVPLNKIIWISNLRPCACCPRRWWWWNNGLDDSKAACTICMQGQCDYYIGRSNQQKHPQSWGQPAFNRVHRPVICRALAGRSGLHANVAMQCARAGMITADRLATMDMQSGWETKRARRLCYYYWLPKPNPPAAPCMRAALGSVSWMRSRGVLVLI